MKNPKSQQQQWSRTEAEEAQYHALIVQEYNNLSEYEQAVQGVIQEFNEQCLNLSSDTRYVCFQNCAGTADEFDESERSTHSRGISLVFSS